MNCPPPTALLLLLLACAGSVARATPPPPGTVSDNVGFSRATEFDGTNFQSLTQDHVAENSDKVLLLAYLAPW